MRYRETKSQSFSLLQACFFLATGSDLLVPNAWGKKFS